MMEKQLEEIRQNRDVRANLIALRQQLKQPGEKEAFLRLPEDTMELMGGLLKHEDPKVRRNAALIIGEVSAGEAGGAGQLEMLYQAYRQERTLFVRADYLKAMELLGCRAYEGKLRERLEEMTGERAEQGISEENRKHYREELAQLQKMLLQLQPGKKHRFTGLEKRYDVILTANRNFREVTAKAVKNSRTPGGVTGSVLGGVMRSVPGSVMGSVPGSVPEVSLVPLGVRVKNADVGQLFKIRTFREMLFTLDISTVAASPEAAAKAIAASNLLYLLKKSHEEKMGSPKQHREPGKEPKAAGRRQEQEEAFRFRITVMGQMPLDQRSHFSKKCSFALEQETGRRLVNAPSDYEVELRLMERKDGTFLPLLKLHTLKDTRFSYRKETIATSIHPSEAALIVELVKPYLKEKAQVLDPCCGVGTMLIERSRAVVAGTMYGIDLFGEAVKKARVNTELAGEDIYYVNRDFFDFTHEYLFDEIIANMPVRGKKTKEEQEAFYRSFFKKAPEVLRKGGILVLYSNEKGYIKKQLRLSDEWKLLHEFCLNEKEGFSVFVIRG